MRQPVSSYAEMREVVQSQHGGLAVTSMQQLRDLGNAGRLGKHVRDRISQSLQDHGLGHLPAELPNDQSAEVRVYVTASAIGQVIEAVLRPSQSGDARLRNVGSEDVVKKLSEVRAQLEEIIETIDE